MTLPTSNPPNVFSSFNALDWFLLLILAYSTIRAFLRGILLELVSFFGLIAGILLAAWNYATLAASLSRWIQTPAAANTVAFLAIVVFVTLLCGLLGRLLRRTAQAAGLGIFDRLLGAIFGLARGCLFAVAIMMAAASFFPTSAWIADSRLAPYFLSGAHAVSFVVPRDLRQRILNGCLRLKHTAPDWINPPQQGDNRKQP